MSEPTKPATGDEPQPDTGTDTQPDTGTEQQQQPDWRNEAERWKSQARRHEERAKANAKAAAELERLRKESMSEQERAAAEAYERGMSDAVSKLSGRVVRSEIKAAVGGRLGVEQVDALVARLDPNGFLGDDGEVDTVAVATFVESILPPPPPEPEAGTQFPDLGQGARGPAGSVPLNGDPLLRSLKAQLGVR